MAQESYIRVLKDSLKSKIELLNKIIVRNEQQRQIFETVDDYSDELDENMEIKSRLVDQIIAIDDGFDQLYKRVGEEIENNKDAYREDIIEMKDMINEITRLSAKVERQEQHNRLLAQKYFSNVKAKIKRKRMNTVAVTRYHDSMTGVGAYTPQFMDNKK